jgi:hypothetical protein
MALIKLGTINIYNDNGEGIKLVIDSEPYLTDTLEGVEGNGETFQEALEDLAVNTEEFQ